MKNNKIIYAILFLTITFIAGNSCNKNTGSGTCEDASTVENTAGFELHIKDTTLNSFIYDKAIPLYNVDSLQVWNSQGTRYKPFKIDAADSISHSAYYAIGVYGLYDSRFDVNMYNDTIKKDIYIRYKLNEWDTLNISYKAYSGQCGSQFAFLQVIHHKKVISYTQDNFIPHFIIKK
jgi:hypothetical protein